MRKAFLLLFSMGLPAGVVAQTLSPSVLAVAGGSARTQTMLLDWTLGEAVVGTATTTTQRYTQGFQQPSLHVSEQPDSAEPEAGYRFSVAPNPVETFLTLTMTTPDNTALQVMMTDMAGRQYHATALPVNTTTTQVDMRAFPAGVYLLRIGKADGAPLKAYKILKSN